MSSVANVGALGYGAIAQVDEHGAIRRGDLTIDWWIGADDHWHFPAEDVTTRRYRPFPAPLFETVMRVPGGEAAHRVYGATSDGAALAVLEVENRSPAPFTVALAISVPRAGRIEIDGATLQIDGEVVLVLPRPPGVWALVSSGGASAPGTLREIVTGGSAQTGPFDGARGPVEIAVLFPVAHRTTLRAALAERVVDVRALPNADTVAHGWDRQLERGMQADLPVPLGPRVDAGRADLLLASRTDPDVVAGLEDWGFDDEAADGWSRLGWGARRRARRRTRPDDSWAAVTALDPDAPAAPLLAAVWAVLLRLSPGAVDLLPGFPPEWLGQSITVDAVPLPQGLLSYAIRWHGARPALLWDAPDGLELRVPALDPAWSSTATSGETLLAEPPAALLPMGVQDQSVGARVAPPEQFS